MMEEFQKNMSEKFESHMLLNKLGSTFSLLKSQSISSNDYHIILFILSIYKENVIPFDVFTKKENFEEQIYSLLEQSNHSSAKFYLLIYDNAYRQIMKRLSYGGRIAILEIFNKIDRSRLSENFQEIFEEMLNKFANLRGKYSGVFIQPLELTRFICTISDTNKDAKIFNPYAGLASFGVYLNKGDYFGQEIDTQTWAIGCLRIMANNREGNTILNKDDSVLNWPKNKKFDLIVSNLPIGLRFDEEYKKMYPGIKSDEQFLLQQGVKSLSDKGKLIGIFPQSVLFNEGIMHQVRKNLVNQDLIESIISLPAGILIHTSISMVILVINKNKPKKGSIRVIDASNFIIKKSPKENILDDRSLYDSIIKLKDPENDRFISLADVKKQNYNLNVTRYLMPNTIFEEKTNVFKLGTVCEIIDGTRRYEDKEGIFIRIRDLKDDNFDFHLDTNNIINDKLPNYAIKIEESCLLIAKRWNSLKPTYFKYSGVAIFLSPDLIALKLDLFKISIPYLISELRSVYVKEQAESFRYGVTIPSIKKDDILDLKIQLPDYHKQENYEASLKEQQAKVEGFNIAYIEAREKELQQTKEILGIQQESYRNLKSIKHTMRQYLNALKSNILGTRLFLENNKDSFISLNSIYSKQLNQTFGDHILGLEGTVESMSKLLLQFDESTTKTEIRIFNIEDLIREAQIRFKDDKQFDFEELYVDRISIQKDNFDSSETLDSLNNNSEEEDVFADIKPLIKISKEDFFQVFSNIVSNAVTHGFKDPEKKYTIRTELSFDLRKHQMMIEISNNGEAVDSGFKFENLITRGEKTIDSNGSGTGGADIYEITKKYSGELKWFIEPEKEFSVTYLIILPIILDQDEN